MAVESLEADSITSGPKSPGPSDHAAPTWQNLDNLERRLAEAPSKGDTWTAAMAIFSAVAVLFSLIGIGLGVRAVNESKKNVKLATAAAASAATTSATTASPTTVAPGADALAPIGVGLSDYHVALPSTSIAAGQVTLNVSNAANQQHELLVFKSDLAPSAYPTTSDGDINEDGPGITKISDGDNLDLAAAQTRSVDLTQPGTYLFVCNLPGHFARGMYSVVTVK